MHYSIRRGAGFQAAGAVAGGSCLVEPRINANGHEWTGKQPLARSGFVTTDDAGQPWGGNCFLNNDLCYCARLVWRL